MQLYFQTLKCCVPVSLTLILVVLFNFKEIYVIKQKLKCIRLHSPTHAFIQSQLSHMLFDLLSFRNQSDTIFKEACFDVLSGKIQVVRICFMRMNPIITKSCSMSIISCWYRIKQVNTCEPSLCRYLYGIPLIWCEIKTCQAADQINEDIITMSAGFFLSLTVPRPKTCSCLNLISGGRKKSSKALLLQCFIPLLWLETASEFLNKANTIMLLNFSTDFGFLASSTGISMELPIVIH